MQVVFCKKSNLGPGGMERSEAEASARGPNQVTEERTVELCTLLSRVRQELKVVLTACENKAV